MSSELILDTSMNGAEFFQLLAQCYILYQGGSNPFNIELRA
jgi:hypothetical protein